MTTLSVNVNKIAVLRNSRGGQAPDVVRAARACLDAGAHGITVHPRPDARHVRADDVLALAELCRARGVEFNLEGNPFAPPREGYPGFHALCAQARPAQATLVPDDDGQLTSDHGFEFAVDGERLRPHVAALKALDCRVSLFVDVGAGDVAAAADTGADRVELYTGPFAEAFAASASTSSARMWRASGRGCTVMPCAPASRHARAARTTSGAWPPRELRSTAILLTLTLSVVIAAGAAPAARAGR